MVGKQISINSYSSNVDVRNFIITFCICLCIFINLIFNIYKELVAIKDAVGDLVEDAMMVMDSYRQCLEDMKKASSNYDSDVQTFIDQIRCTVDVKIDTSSSINFIYKYHNFYTIL